MSRARLISEYLLVGLGLVALAPLILACALDYWLTRPVPGRGSTKE